MYKRVLLLLDLEGVNFVKGEPYLGLVRDSDEWKIAVNQAPHEINAAADALFAAGVSKVGLWDNHGAAKNLDISMLDPRIDVIFHDPAKPRLDFAKGEFDCVCYFGYHAMEGTLGGVLAHTMNSKGVQFYKINGKYVGEIDMDAYISASLGMPSCFFAAGNIACKQAKHAVPNIVTVTTKTELSRNEAEFRDNDELLLEIREKIVLAVKQDHPVNQLEFPAIFEKSFKRVEDAAKHLEKVRNYGIEADYPDDEILGKDAHTVRSVTHNILQFIRAI